MYVTFDNQFLQNISKILAQETTTNGISSMFHDLNLKDFDEQRLDEFPQMSHTTKWKRIYETFRYEIQNHHGSPEPVFGVIEYLLKPVNYISTPNQWSSIRKSINSVLIFTGFALGDDGLVTKIKAATTMSEALNRLQTFREQLGPLHLDSHVTKYCTKELLHEDYFHAIFEASKGVLDRLRRLSGSSLDGTQLINNLFNLRAPILFIRGNRLSTQDEKDMYFAASSIFKTIVYMYRNPKAHKVKIYDETSLDDAVVAFVIMSKAHQIIDTLMTARGWDE
ncbi:TIGR02391 family protein [Lacticaseibacillus hegangensis]|uniref:TIGR02391 family protein n=1 Tax=Lacticaseibacillus hegangensis TaxID=2486010 RepID=A0ABW4CX85_9LACO|nr:TIGR02391 family protein [Lacticaseibacillus hegangensis]